MTAPRIQVVSVAAALILSACGSSSPDASPSSPMPTTPPPTSPPPNSPSPTPIQLPPIPDGKYSTIATRADAIRFGLREDRIEENTGHFTLIINEGRWELIQRADHPIQFPDNSGIYTGTGHSVVFEVQSPAVNAGTTTCRWAFHPGSKTLTFVVLAVSVNDGPDGTIAADRTIWQSHPWRKVG
jgi:hypothetical protein